MKRIMGLAAILLLVPIMSSGEEPKTKKVMMFPFRVLEKGSPESLSKELAGVLGSLLAREGDLEIASADPFADLVRNKKVDTARLARLANRSDSAAVIWGTVSKLDDGYSLEVSVMGRDERQKPRPSSAIRAT